MIEISNSPTETAKQILAAFGLQIVVALFLLLLVPFAKYMTWGLGVGQLASHSQRVEFYPLVYHGAFRIICALVWLIGALLPRNWQDAWNYGFFLSSVLVAIYIFARSHLVLRSLPATEPVRKFVALVAKESAVFIVGFCLLLLMTTILRK